MTVSPSMSRNDASWNDALLSELSSLLTAERALSMVSSICRRSFSLICPIPRFALATS